MIFTKHTPDRYFKITVESALMDQMDEDEQIPSEAMASLILELEILAAELKKLLGDDGLKTAH